MKKWLSIVALVACIAAIEYTNASDRPLPKWELKHFKLVHLYGSYGTKGEASAAYQTALTTAGKRVTQDDGVWWSTLDGGSGIIWQYSVWYDDGLPGLSNFISDFKDDWATIMAATVAYTDSRSGGDTVKAYNNLIATFTTFDSKYSATDVSRSLPIIFPYCVAGCAQNYYNCSHPYCGIECESGCVTYFQHCYTACGGSWLNKKE